MHFQLDKSGNLSRTDTATDTTETFRSGSENQLKQWLVTLPSMTRSATNLSMPSDLLTATFDGLTDGLAIFDAEEKLVLCNESFRDQLNPIAGLLGAGTSWRSILRACIEKKLATGLVSGDVDAACDKLRTATDRQTFVGQSNGRFYDLSYTPLENGGFFITRADVTERKAAESRLKERNELIRMVVESCPAPILMNRADTGEILFISPQAAALYGVQTNSRDYYVSPDDRQTFIGELRRHREVHEYRLKLKNAKGEPFWCAVSARLILWGGEDVIVSHARDLTSHLAIEDLLARQREHVFQSEKMSALGGLLAGVAHELNNPLSVVVGHAIMLSEESDDPDVQRQIRKIADAAERCSKIVRTFLTVARKEPAQSEPVDVVEMIETAVDVARYGETARAIDIEFEMEAELPKIIGDQNQLTQAIVNLIINAQQAIEESGVGDQIRVVAQPDEQKKALLLVVEDNGPGIASDIRGRIFEPFFTTKGVGQGTGMGLALCDRVVAAHKGRIEISDVDPKGTRFLITLPTAKTEQLVEQRVGAMNEESNSVRVLVIDDEVDVADLNVEMLRRGGYDAVAAHQPENVLSILRSQRYDVVLSDLNMPGLDGRGVFEAISREFPELVSRIGFVTGDTMGKASQAFLKESRRPYIEKPVSPKELCAFAAQLSMEGSSE